MEALLTMVVRFSKFLHQAVSKFEEVISESGLSMVLLMPLSSGFSGLTVVVVVRTANPTPEVVMVVQGGTEVVGLVTRNVNFINCEGVVRIVDLILEVVGLVI